ncbi:MAG: L,D-transpeptidase family protein [Chloroflexota bacterium]|nr:L,D-transpeptidase family protein [Chloroflexota bacterium]
MDGRVDAVGETSDRHRDAQPLSDVPASEESTIEFIARTRRARWSDPRRWLNVVLVLSFAMLLSLTTWLFLQPRGEAATPSHDLAIHPLSPALQLKREAGQLWVSGERVAALERWKEAHQLSPDNPDITESLARAQVGVAADYLRANNPDGALPLLEAAYKLMPDESAVLHEYQALLAYLEGREAVEAHSWDRAIEALGPLHNLDTNYLDVHDLLETALASKQQERAEQRARSDRAASQVRLAAPGQRLAALLDPPELHNTPGQTTAPSLDALASSANKHIVVSINNQRMYVYENGQLIWDWTASTGEYARPTVPGRYRIQSKIENARSNVWSLWMPYWQGIYWAGSVENGIHGQVTFDRGGRLWEGYLGTRITYGCVMISDENAATLYNWTEIGTPVSIHWDWDPTWIPDENGDPV